MGLELFLCGLIRFPGRGFGDGAWLVGFGFGFVDCVLTCGWVCRFCVGML